MSSTGDAVPIISDNRNRKLGDTMKKIILLLITFIAGLAFVIAGGCLGGDYSNVLACAIVMYISLAWILLFIYANTR